MAGSWAQTEEVRPGARESRGSQSFASLSLQHLLSGAPEKEDRPQGEGFRLPVNDTGAFRVPWQEAGGETTTEENRPPTMSVVL